MGKRLVHFLFSCTYGGQGCVAYYHSREGVPLDELSLGWVYYLYYGEHMGEA